MTFCELFKRVSNVFEHCEINLLLIWENADSIGDSCGWGCNLQKFETVIFFLRKVILS